MSSSQQSHHGSIPCPQDENTKLLPALPRVPIPPHLPRKVDQNPAVETDQMSGGVFSCTLSLPLALGRGTGNLRGASFSAVSSEALSSEEGGPWGLSGNQTCPRQQDQ